MIDTGWQLHLNHVPVRLETDSDNTRDQHKKYHGNSEIEDFNLSEVDRVAPATSAQWQLISDLILTSKDLGRAGSWPNFWITLIRDLEVSQAEKENQIPSATL